LLFSSLSFLFLFLPLAVAAFHLVRRVLGRPAALLVLIAASLVFYAVADPRAVPLLLASVVGNYALARLIERAGQKGLPLTLGVLANIAFLGWFKYAGFFAGIAADLAGTQWTVTRVLIPLGISFFTLQQIAFLVDVARGEVKTAGLLAHANFVLFFPQLTAGPIVRGRETMPQFASRRLGRFACANLSVGTMLFAIGLFKKTVIADPIAVHATPVYTDVAGGLPVGFADAWMAAIGFSLQVYFDFSGYSDMAIGAARMFGIRLPVNFHSPLRAPSVIEYWRRWHMTLQRFIVSYLFQPLVMPLARFAAERGLGKWPNFLVATALPMVLTFVLVGLWHGAAWTFVLFGLMHGIYLAVNESWRLWRRKARRTDPPGRGSIAFYHLLTLLAVVFANVMFRADSVEDALRIWAAMGNVGDWRSVAALAPQGLAGLVLSPLPLFAAAILVVALLPNSNQLLARYRPALDYARVRGEAPPPIRLAIRPTAGWALALGLILFFGFAFILRGEAQFIYRNF
jgi:D-alanyl-lipoteichoic acid acyltransferase DltB (MBOAT superfamily)